MPLVVLHDAVPTAIVDVRVFDSEKGVVTGPCDILLQNGKVQSIDPPGEPVPNGVIRVDGHGATLLPGLVDVHVHLGGTFVVPGHFHVPDVSRNLADFLYAGVTTVLDLSMPMRELDRYRRRLRHGLPGPHVYGSGRPFTSPGGHPFGTLRAMVPPALGFLTNHAAWPVATAADVDHAVVVEGPRDVFKVMIDALPGDAPAIDDEALARLRRAATALARPLVAHVGRPEDVDRALALPVDALAHAPYAAPLSDAQIARLVDQTIPVMPTLAVWQALADARAGTPVQAPLETDVLTPTNRRDLEKPGPAPANMTSWLDDLVAHRADRFGNVVRMRDAGVRLLVGSDAPQVDLAAGSGTHREIDLLEEAGLTPAETLRAATWWNSRFLDPQADFGAIEPGYRADLLLVDGDPVADPSALHRIRAVWVDGRAVERHP